MVTVEFRQTRAPLTNPPHVSLWYTGMDEELNPFPCTPISQVNSKGDELHVQFLSQSSQRKAELMSSNLSRSPAIQSLSDDQSPTEDNELTVPMSMVIAPAIIIRLRPILSPQKNVIRLPTAHPISCKTRLR